MTEAALTPTRSLAIGNVLRDTSKLYRDLFGRTVLTGFIVFGVVGLFETIAPTPVIILSIVGTALVQGALVEAVADRHNSGRRVRSAISTGVRGTGSGGSSEFLS